MIFHKLKFEMLKNKLKNLYSNEFLKNIFTLFSGTVLAQLIPFFIAPILTRIYSPENFGDLALFISIASVLSILYSGSYEGAILLPKKLNDSYNIVGLAILIVFANSILFFIISCFTNKYINVFSDVNFNRIILIFIPLAAILFSFEKILNSWHNRLKKYRKISSTNVSKSIVNSSIQITFGKLKYLNFGLLIGEVTGRLVQIILLTNSLIKNKKLEGLKLSLAQIKIMAKSYYEFPKFSLFSQLLNIISSQLPIFLLTYFFGQQITGFYSLTYRYLRAPLVLLSASVSEVFYQRAAQMHNNNQDVGAFTLKIIKQLFLFGIIPFSIITVFGDIIFAFVFGSEWKLAGVFAQYMAPWLLFNISISPISTIFYVLKKQKQGLIANIILFVLRLSPLALGGILFKDSVITIIIYSFSGCFFYIGYTMYVMKILNIKQRQIFSLIIPLIITLIFLILIRLYIF